MTETLVGALAAAGRDRPCVLIRSSRAGGWMLVHVDGAVGSLGGGPIEDRAIAHARDMLARLAEPAQEPAGDAIEIGDADGASGMLTLIFETMRPLGPGSLEEWRRSARELVRGSTASGQSSHQPDEASR